MSRSITQNTAFLTTASVLQKAVSFVYFTLVARLMGASDTGAYFFALSFSLIFTVVADFGLNSILTRELSKSPERAGVYVSSMFWTKLTLGVLAYGVLLATVALLRYSPLIITLTAVAGLTVFFDNLLSVGYCLFRARHNLIYESIAVVSSQLLTLIIGTTALLARAPLIWLMAAYAVPSFLNAIVSLILCRRVYGIRYRFQVDLTVLKTFLLFAWPIALTGIISRLYSYTDTVIMSKILSPTALGHWSVPYKIIFAFQFVPAALTVSAYPVMSRLFMENKERLAELFSQVLRYLIFLSVPMALGLAIIARPFIIRVYTAEYLPSVLSLQIIGFTFISGFISYAAGAVFNAINKQKIQTALLAVAWILSAVFNLLLIPRLGISGAALVSLATSAFLGVFGYYFAARLTGLNHRQIFKYCLQALSAGALMAGAVYALEPRVGFILAAAMGALIYLFILYVNGGVDYATLKNAWQKIFSRAAYE